MPEDCLECRLIGSGAMVRHRAAASFPISRSLLPAPSSNCAASALQAGLSAYFYLEFKKAPAQNRRLQAGLSAAFALAGLFRLLA